MGKTGNRIVPLSEESITLVTSYRPSIIMMPYRIPSFRAGARMLCEKNGKQDSATERRIYYPDDALTSLRHYDALPYPVIQSGGKNAL